MFNLKDFNKIHSVVLATNTSTTPNMRTVHILAIADSLYILTTKSSLKSEELKNNPYATLYHLETNDNGFIEQRLYAKLISYNEINMDLFKEKYLEKFPYMATSADYIFGRPDNQIYKVQGISYRNKTPKNDDTQVF